MAVNKSHIIGLWSCFPFYVCLTFPKFHTPMKFSEPSVFPFYTSCLHREYFGWAFERLSPSKQPPLNSPVDKNVIDYRCDCHLKNSTQHVYILYIKQLKGYFMLYVHIHSGLKHNWTLKLCLSLCLSLWASSFQVLLNLSLGNNG